MLGKSKFLPILVGLCAMPLGAWLKGLTTTADPSVSLAPVEVRVKDVVPERPTALSVSKRPTIEAILESSDEAQLRLMAQFLPEATLAEVDVLRVAEEMSLNGEPVRTDMWKLLLARRSVLDPLGTLTLVRDRAQEQNEIWMEGWCFIAWSTFDPMGALEEAEKPPQKHLDSVMDALIKVDFAEAVALSQRYPEKDQLRTKVMKAWATEDLKGALAHLDSLTEKQQAASFTSIMQGLAAADARKALALALEQEDPERREDALFTVMPEFIKEAPDEVEPHLRTLPDNKRRFRLLTDLAVEFAKRDPDRAMQRALELQDASERRAGLAKAFEAMEFDSLEDRLAMVHRLGMDEALPNPREISRSVRSSGGSGSYIHGSDLNHSFGRTVKTLAEDDPQAALRLVAEFPPRIGASDFNPRAHFLRDLSKTWARGEHRDGFVGMIASIPEDSRSNMLSAAIENAEQATYEWLGGEISAAPEETFNAEMIGQVASEWLEVDTLSASEWIGQLPAGEKQDRALDHMLRTLTSGDQQDLEAAFAWSQVLSVAAQREDHMKRIYPRWEAEEPVLAKEALSSADISDALLEELVGKETQP